MIWNTTNTADKLELLKHMHTYIYNTYINIYKYYIYIYIYNIVLHLLVHMHFFMTKICACKRFLHSQIQGLCRALVLGSVEFSN